MGGWEADLAAPLEGGSASNVISFAEAKAARDPHVTGTAICVNCQRQWVATEPLGSVWLPCPSCTLVRGRFLHHAEIREGSHWTCPCSCTLFFITPENVYCPNCGATQNFPDPPPTNDFAAS